MSLAIIAGAPIAPSLLELCAVDRSTAYPGAQSAVVAVATQELALA